MVAPPTQLRRRLLARLAPLALAAGAGAVWGLAFGATTWPVASWGALAPLVVLIARPRAASAWGMGWVHGLATWLVAIPWIVPTLVTFGGLSTGLAWFSLFLLAAYLALFHAAFAALVAPLFRRGGGWLALAGAPAVWVALEWVRGWLFGGFPWNLAGTAWERVPGALPLSAWVGIWGVSYLIVFANAGLGLGVAAVAGRTPRRRFALAAVGVLAPLAVLPAAGRWAAGEPPAGAGSPVAIVQPNIANATTVDWQQIGRDYRRLFAMSREACRAGGPLAAGETTLVVWPESASWPYDWYRDPALQRDLGELAAGGCPVLFNALTPAGESYHNSALVLAPDGAIAAYHKRKLVPFGEYVPLAGIVPFVDTLARASGRLVASEEVRLLPWGGQELGAAICFEVVFPEVTAELTRAGATALVTITNDAWYGDSSAPHQHFRAARFRAAENRRPLIRAAITGISALVGPDGGVAARLGVGEEGILTGRVAGRSDRSPFVCAPWAVPVFCVVLGLFAILAGRRSRP